MADAILTLNAGSSSLKFAVYLRGAGGLTLHSKGQVEGIGTAPHLVAPRRRRQGARRAALGRGRGADARGFPRPVPRRASSAISATPGWSGSAIASCTAGTRFTAPVRVDAGGAGGAGGLVPLAPLHQPHNLAPIRAVAELRPDLPQVACFDTAFHRATPGAGDARSRCRARLTDEAASAATASTACPTSTSPARLRESAPELARGRVIVAHLGNGASLCAMRDGRSVATTMGFTALDGLVMGTRCGALDPGVVLYLMQQRGMTRAPRSRTLLYKQSGLLGVSGHVAATCATLLASDDPHAREAVELFVYRIARRDRLAGGGARRARRARVHRRHRRARAGGARRDLRPLGLARRRARRRGANAPAGPRISARREPRAGLGDPDRRGADDRARRGPAARVRAIRPLVPSAPSTASPHCATRSPATRRTHWRRSRSVQHSNIPAAPEV